MDSAAADNFMVNEASPKRRPRAKKCDALWLKTQHFCGVSNGNVACPEVKRVLKSQVGGPNKEGRTSVRSVGNRGSPKTKETRA